MWCCTQRPYTTEFDLSPSSVSFVCSLEIKTRTDGGMGFQATHPTAMWHVLRLSFRNNPIIYVCRFYGCLTIISEKTASQKKSVVNVKLVLSAVYECDRDVPTNVRDGPMNVRGVPTNVRDAPTNVRDAPTNVRSVPTSVRGVPTNVRDAPTNVRDAPTNVRGVPTNVRDAPTNVRGVPTNVRGASMNV
jgi:hypothetical protein